MSILTVAILNLALAAALVGVLVSVMTRPLLARPARVARARPRERQLRGDP
ncbi:MAG TPA: hypothetical protein VMV08_00610 [Gaiellaceae bacterium]|nr:hypothetical protein [Gaiellaceae bacterium]